jgi:hypothetical protein
MLGGRNNPRSAGERERLERAPGPGASPAPLPRRHRPRRAAPPGTASIRSSCAAPRSGRGEPACGGRVWMPPCARPRWDPAGFAGGQAPGQSRRRRPSRAMDHRGVDDWRPPRTLYRFRIHRSRCDLQFGRSPACARIAVHGSSPALRDRNPGIRRQSHVSPSWGLPEDVEPVYPGAALPDPGLDHDIEGRAVQRPSAAGADDLDVEVRQRRPDQAELAGRTAISRSSCSLVISPRNRSSAQPAATHHRTPAPASRPATSRGRQASQGGSPPASAQPAASHHQP